MKVFKKAILTQLILISASISAYSQTIISDSVLVNTTWALSGSPYIVTNEIVVKEGVTLTVDPGVEVKFNNNTGIKLFGTLTAIGTETDSIAFTSNSATPGIGAWDGIFVIGTTDPFGEGDQVTMKYVKGSYSESFVNLDLAYHGPYIFENCYFSYNNVVNLDGGAPYTSFTSCDFEFNNCGLNYFQFPAEIKHCNFVNNLHGAINVPSVDSCYFFNNSGTALAPYGSTTNCILIKNNIAVSCPFNAVNNTFTNNIVVDNNRGVEILSFFEGIEFTGNRICNNHEFNIMLFSDHDADLSMNCWCTSDESVIGSYIMDDYDNSALGVVTLNPFGNDCPTNVLSTGEEKIMEQVNVNVYPNPFNAQFEIEVDSDENLKIVLFDMSGREMLNQNFNSRSTISAEHLTSGVYIYKILLQNQVISNGRVVKE